MVHIDGISIQNSSGQTGDELNVAQQEDIYVSRMKVHAQSFTEIMDNLIENLQDSGIVAEQLKELGRLHAKQKGAGLIYL